MSSERLLERFLRYVRVHTTAREDVEEYPSSPGQLALGKLIAAELAQLGLAEVEHDEHGLVWASVPATFERAAPVVALNAHLDTSPETSGENVRPQVIRNYAGGDIALPGGGRVIRASDSPELEDIVGRTLITTDGTTLLGADDKAGVAVIVEAAARLLEAPEIPHGTVKVLFTCDEEIGRGTLHVDLERLAADVCYTLDGQGAGEIDGETFSADLAAVTVRGVNTHPSVGKNRMVNAIKAAGAFLSRLPPELSPEMTEGREGFVHPYTIEGGVAEVKLKVLLRSFSTEELSRQAELVRKAAELAERDCPGAKVSVTVRAQYRNMAEGLAAEPRAIALAEEAHRRLGLPCKRTIVRGGTDGSQLTERGLPTPNLSTGQHNLHSPLEWACLEEMEQAVQVVLELVKRWGEEQL